MNVFLDALATIVAAAIVAGVGFLVRELISQGRDLAVVKGQLHNNGGKTLKDAVDRIEEGQSEIQKTMQDHLVVAAGDSARLAVLWSKELAGTLTPQ